MAGIELRHAVAELTWKPKDREMQAAFDRKLTLWHAAVAERQRRGFSVERQGGMRCHDQYQSSVCVGVNYHKPSIGSSVVRTLMLRSCLFGQVFGWELTGGQALRAPSGIRKAPRPWACAG